MNGREERRKSVPVCRVIVDVTGVLLGAVDKKCKNERVEYGSTTSNSRFPVEASSLPLSGVDAQYPIVAVVNTIGAMKVCTE